MSEGLSLNAFDAVAENMTELLKELDGRAARKMLNAPPKEWNMKDMPDIVPIALVP